MLEFDRPRSMGWRRPEGSASLSHLAMEEQLGMKLVQKEIPFDVIVIEQIEKNPVEN